MENLFISLPIELASDDLISKQYDKRTEETVLIFYSVDVNVIGFSSIISPEDREYICESEEEFKQKVAEYKLMRLLWNSGTLASHYI